MCIPYFTHIPRICNLAIFCYMWFSMRWWFIKVKKLVECYRLVEGNILTRSTLPYKKNIREEQCPICLSSRIVLSWSKICFDRRFGFSMDWHLRIKSHIQLFTHRERKMKKTIFPNRIFTGDPRLAHPCNHCRVFFCQRLRRVCHCLLQKFHKRHPRDVMVIVDCDEHDELSSNSGQDYLYFTSFQCP